MLQADRLPFVLLVEDNDGDVVLINEALTERRSKKHIISLRDGQEAVDWLENRITNNLALPDVMIVDINLPRMNGHERLSWMQSQKALRQTRVMVFTTSGSEQDIRKAYDSGAAAFLTKPIDLDDFTALFDTIEAFWFNQVSLYP